MIHETAIVDNPGNIGPGTRVWHFSHVTEGATIGSGCNLGQNVYVGGRVKIGDNVKIQNNVSIYDGTTIESDVFLGPSCVLTNVRNPRSQIVRRSIYEETLLKRGCTVGANATIVCGTTIGRYAFIAAGAVVTRDVPDYGLLVGVPGKLAGWMSRHGHPLPAANSEGSMVCPESGFRYVEEQGRVRCLDLDEEAPLPQELATGHRPHDEIKAEAND